jgi:hypothetical protein
MAVPLLHFLKNKKKNHSAVTKRVCSDCGLALESVNVWHSHIWRSLHIGMHERTQINKQENVVNQLLN